MIEIYTTTEVAQKTGLTDRSVRRRINGEIRNASERISGVVVTNTTNGRRTLGVTKESLTNYLRNR